MKVDVCITSKDRWSELAITLVSLGNQTHTDWDVFILDDKSGTPVEKSYFLNKIFSRLRLEGHRVKLIRNEIPKGVCGGRNLLIEETNKYGKGDLILRCDDDVWLKPNYIEKLIEGINEGYDLMSGLIPLLELPENKRKTKYVKPIINEHKIDEKGELTQQKDECGFGYIEKVIIPTHHFRTNALYKKEIQTKIKYPTNLSHTGFREEGFFSFKAILEGYKLGIHTGATAYHLQCPSGGVRATDYAQRVQQDDKLFKDWIKKKFEERGNFLEEYNKQWT